MKRKVFLFAGILCFLLSLPLAAQTEKGKFVLSGRSSFDFAYSANALSGGASSQGLEFTHTFDTDNYQYSLMPSFGYFFANNWALGCEVSYALSNGDNQNKTTQLAFMPTLAFYIPTGKVVRPMAAVGIGYTHIGVVIPTDYTTDVDWAFNGLTWGASLGAAFFVSKHVSIDLLAQYLELHTSFEKESHIKLRSHGIGGSIGFSVFF